MTAAQLGFETSRTKGKGNDLVRAANAHGFTLRTLAPAVEKRTKIRTTHTHLSLAYKGERPLTDEVKRAVRDLTGFDAWPQRK